LIGLAFIGVEVKAAIWWLVVNEVG